MWLMNRMKKFKEFCSKKDAQNTKKSTKFAIQAFRAFVDLQTAEESVKNLDKRLARFFANFFFIFFMNILVFRYNISFIDPERGEFGEIFPEVMIFPEGFSPREISSMNDNYYMLSLHNRPLNQYAYNAILSVNLVLSKYYVTFYLRIYSQYSFLIKC